MSKQKKNPKYAPPQIEGDVSASEPESLQWVEERLPLATLKPFERNPRTITESQYEKLKTSIRELGYNSRIKVTHDHRIIGGHQRLRAIKDLATESGVDIKSATIPVLVPTRALTEYEFKQVLIRDNVNNGVFDLDMLANDFSLEDLKDWGVHEILNIAPEEPAPAAGGGIMVCCPSCSEVFPVKGNKAKS